MGDACDPYADVAGGEVFYQEGVEDGLGAWTPSGLWHVTSRRASAGTASFWYGREDTGAYDTGAPNSGTLLSPVIDLSNVLSPVLLFDQFIDIESDPSNSLTVDLLTVTVTSVDTLEQLVVARNRASTDGAFLTRQIGLSGFSYDRVRIAFEFDTVDEYYNAYEGWYVDRMRIVGSLDQNGDGVSDDNCPYVINPDQADLDADDVGDACDTDIDGDGATNFADNCVLESNPTQEDVDDDGAGDACDARDDRDLDGDGLLNGADNCPFDENSDQADIDEDGRGDVCDPIDGSLSVALVRLKGDTSDARNNGAVAMKGNLTQLPGDVLTAAAGIGFRVQDVLGIDVSTSWLASDCAIKASGRITCRSADRSARIKLQPVHSPAGAYRIAARLKRLTITGPFAGPITATVRYGQGIDRMGAIAGCGSVKSGLSCSAP